MSDIKIIVSLEIDGTPVAQGASTYHAIDTVTAPADVEQICPFLVHAASDALLDLVESALLGPGR